MENGNKQTTYQVLPDPESLSLGAKHIHTTQIHNQSSILYLAFFLFIIIFFFLTLKPFLWFICDDCTNFSSHTLDSFILSFEILLIIVRAYNFTPFIK